MALHPDVKRPVGGAKQMHRLAECIESANREAFIIQGDADFHPSWFSSSVKTVAYESWKQRSDLHPERDIVILPETFLSSLSSYMPGFPTVIFNQNVSYSFGVTQITQNPLRVLSTYSSDSISHVLCVSQHDLAVLRDGFALDQSRISLVVNAIETGMFRPAKRKKRQIAFMPRKNSLDASVVCALLSRQEWFKGWRFVPIQNATLQEVSQIFSESLIFLSFGHPEGFGLPVAEAFASGCCVIGYSGLGGRELFSLAATFDVSFEIAFGDWLGFVNAVKSVVSRVDAVPQQLMSELQQSSELFVKTYSFDAMRCSVISAIQSIESRLLLQYSSS